MYAAAVMWFQHTQGDSTASSPTLAFQLSKKKKSNLTTQICASIYAYLLCTEGRLYTASSSKSLSMAYMYTVTTPRWKGSRFHARYREVAAIIRVITYLFSHGFTRNIAPLLPNLARFHKYSVARFRAKVMLRPARWQVAHSHERSVKRRSPSKWHLPNTAPVIAKQ